MRINTREDLLFRMRGKYACFEAMTWVKGFDPGTSALTIWRACPHKDWLTWYLCNVENERLFKHAKGMDQREEDGGMSLAGEFVHHVEENNWWPWSTVGDFMTLDELRSFWDDQNGVAPGVARARFPATRLQASQLEVPA